MSTTLCFSPKAKRKDYCCYGLKRILGPKLWGHDGSLGSDWTEVGYDLVPFLEGVVAATGDDEIARDAQMLIDLITEHDGILLSLKS